jgi:hypothetical protein
VQCWVTVLRANKLNVNLQNIVQEFLIDVTHLIHRRDAGKILCCILGKCENLQVIAVEVLSGNCGYVTGIFVIYIGHIVFCKAS